MKKVKRQVTFPSQNQCNINSLHEGKKENSLNRHSYHHGTHFSSFDQPFYNTINYKELLKRQRSFVNPKSIREQANPIDEQFNFQRQRSFVVPHQYQVRGSNQRQRCSAQFRAKPAMELYKPPTMRTTNEIETPSQYNGKATNIYDGRFHDTKSDNKPGLNIHAKEFVLQHSKSGHNLKRGTMFNSTGVNASPRVRFTGDTENEPDKKGRSNVSESSTYGGGHPVKRSKSLGSADFRNSFISERSPLSEIGPFAQDIHNIISRALNEPNTLNTRQLMDVVKHVYLRVIESSRYAEPTARLCICIIEKETGETFLETLLNTCQEYFQEKDRLLRNKPPGPYPGYSPSHTKWIAYMSFLNEMYTQLKRRSIQLMTQRMQSSGNQPGLVLLTLLAQCCSVCLKESAVNSLTETECLFFVLTAVGRDIETEIPQQMSRVMGAARDAFLQWAHVAAVRKTLLQLIEMHAARWQLPASAVMYYYPGSGAKI